MRTIGKVLLLGVVCWLFVLSARALGAEGDVTFEDSGGSCTSDGDSTFVWDATNDRLGIGTDTPEVPLHLYGGDSQQSTPYTYSRVVVEDDTHAFINVLTPSDCVGGISFGDDGDSDAGGIKYQHEHDRIIIYTTGAYALAVNSSGYVGLGSITSPSEVLDVGGNVKVRGSAIFNEYGSNADFRVEGDTDANLVFVDASADKVGIGTTSPGAKLDVRGSAIFNEAGTNADFRVEGDTDANLVFVDASADKVGIGTSSPGEKLEVNGNLKVNGTITSTGEGGKLAKVLIDTYEGNNTDNRMINLGDDYDEIYIHLEENYSDTRFLVRAWAIKTAYGLESQRDSYHQYTWTMANGNFLFQGKQTGAYANYIKLGSDGDNVNGTNLNGKTYRIIAKKFSSVETLP